LHTQLKELHEELKELHEELKELHEELKHEVYMLSVPHQLLKL